MVQGVKVADDQIKYLAQRSKELDQETRVSVYTFADNVKCVIYDKDVLRLPSISQFYNPQGWTALIDATIKSQEDLALTPEIYGEHAFLTFVLTDGAENASKRFRSRELQTKLASLPDHWTVAVLVPDAVGLSEAKRFGFPANNIAVWDTSSTRGLNEAVDKIRVATDNFMTNRTQGIRGSRDIFSTGVEAVNTQTVKENLQFLKKGTYEIFEVKGDEAIRPFIESVKGQGTYIIGGAYYQLTKREKIQAQKQIAVRDKRNGNIYVGAEARGLLGLPNTEVSVKPDHNPLYEVFVQSTSVNRKLVRGTRLLYFPGAPGALPAASSISANPTDANGKTSYKTSAAVKTAPVAKKVNGMTWTVTDGRQNFKVKFDKNAKSYAAFEVIPDGAPPMTRKFDSLDHVLEFLQTV